MEKLGINLNIYLLSTGFIIIAFKMNPFGYNSTFFSSTTLFIIGIICLGIGSIFSINYIISNRDKIKSKKKDIIHYRVNALLYLLLGFAAVLIGWSIFKIKWSSFIAIIFLGASRIYFSYARKKEKKPLSTIQGIKNFWKKYKYYNS